MKFSRQNSERELPATLIIFGLKKIEHVREAIFLGVIGNENMTWEKHISTDLLSKMARYIGIMYKLKRILPLQTRIQIYHIVLSSRILITVR